MKPIIGKMLKLLGGGKKNVLGTLRDAQNTSSLTRRWLQDSKGQYAFARPTTILLLTLFITISGILEASTSWYRLPQDYKDVLLPSYTAVVIGYFGLRTYEKVKEKKIR